MKKLIGSVINIGHVYCTVSEVLYADYWDSYGWDIEFKDEYGHYRHWKQWNDGGTITFPEKRYKDCYGMDVTDLFRKYGYV